MPISLLPQNPFGVLGTLFKAMYLKINEIINAVNNPPPPASNILSTWVQKSAIDSGGVQTILCGFAPKVILITAIRQDQINGSIGRASIFSGGFNTCLYSINSPAIVTNSSQQFCAGSFVDAGNNWIVVASNFTGNSVDLNFVKTGNPIATDFQFDIIG